MSTGAANRRKGTQYESDLVRHFRGKGMDTERLRLSGKEDEGDIVVRVGKDQRIIVEAKSGKNIRPRFWFDEEAVPEAKNYTKRRSLSSGEVIPALVMKSHNRAIGKSLVTIDLDTFVDLLERSYRG